MMIPASLLVQGCVLCGMEDYVMIPASLLLVHDDTSVTVTGARWYQHHCYWCMMVPASLLLVHGDTSITVTGA